MAVQVYVAAEIRAAAGLIGDGYRDLTAPIAARLDALARRLGDAHRAGDESMCVLATCWHPDHIGGAAAAILAAPFSLTDARETVAREHGFADWSAVEALGDARSDAGFERAVDALLAGDLAALRAALADRPSLISARSRFGHRATLLHYAGSNGVETYRQRVPLNLVDVTRALLDAGAEVDAVADIYGGATTLALLVSSAHPAEAGVVDDVAAVLVAAGAATSP